jgi:hypothetical protein
MLLLSCNEYKMFRNLLAHLIYRKAFGVAVLFYVVSKINNSSFHVNYT